MTIQATTSANALRPLTVTVFHAHLATNVLTLASAFRNRSPAVKAVMDKPATDQFSHNDS